MNNIGRIKYTINFHDGVKTHSDGSPFYDITIFSSKVKLAKFRKDLLTKGYIER